MWAIVRKSTGQIETVAETPHGYDPAEFDAIETSVNPLKAVWNGTEVVERPPSHDELARDALISDELWARLNGSTPAQLDSWLAGNVTDLASARRVLKFILLALKQLRRSV